MFRFGSALIFITMVMLYASTINVLDRPFSIELIIAAMIGGYMAMNIGANDVANAVGPLAAINDAVVSGGVAAKASIPIWVMAVGAIGIVLGLALFGPK